MNNITNLTFNTKTERDSSVSIVLTGFSYKNAISDKEASVASGHFILFQGKKRI